MYAIRSYYGTWPRRQMPEIFVAAGSNIQPRARLRQAIALMREAWPDLRVSRAYLNKRNNFV